MKLSLNGIKLPADWPKYSLPAFDISAMAERTKKEPVWLHMGAGNIFRIFPAVLQQELIEAGYADRGIIVCECYDDELIPASMTPYDNLSLAVTLKADGNADKKIVASMAEAITASTGRERLMEVCAAPSLQMITFTITEKGYKAADPHDTNNIMNYITDGLLKRYKAGAPPLSLVSMDNCSQNGSVLKNAVKSTAEAKIKENKTEPDFIQYIESLAFPWTMIDKIVPRPSVEVAKILEAEGYENTAVKTTAKGTWIASFVNGEECQYLVIEDSFPNGRPPLEKAGVLFTDRETVEKSEKMKVCTCLNPLHTVLATAGCMLGYTFMSDVIGDKHLRAFAEHLAFKESMPVVVNPGIIDPKKFLHDVLNERIPNPFIKDTPQRIAEDNSQKIPIRFGETIKARRNAGLPDTELEAIPFFFAIYARYLMGVDDKLEEMPVERDPRRDELMAHMKGPYNLRALFSDAGLFGVDLYADKGILAKKAEAYFSELTEGPGAVARALEKYYG